MGTEGGAWGRGVALKAVYLCQRLITLPPKGPRKIPSASGFCGAPFGSGLCTPRAGGYALRLLERTATWISRNRLIFFCTRHVSVRNAFSYRRQRGASQLAGARTEFSLLLFSRCYHGSFIICFVQTSHLSFSPPNPGSSVQSFPPTVFRK